MDILPAAAHVLEAKQTRMETWKTYYWLRRRDKTANLSLRLAAIIVLSVFLGGLALAVSGLGAVGAVYAHFSQQLPSADEFITQAGISFKTTKIYDRTGETLLYELLPPEGGDRTYVPLHQIPEHVRYATIALEDRTFYDNPAGINISGLVRAAVNNLRGLPVQGGSSIAQQVVRNVIMTPEERYERSYARKIKETILAFELTRKYPGVEGKDRILEWYLNSVSYGFPTGVQAAAEYYFGKHVEELDLAEAAMLAHIPQYPALNPIDNLVEAERRQEIVLDQMYLQGYITAAQAWEAKQETLSIAAKPFDIKAPHFVMYVRKQLVDRFGADLVYRSGLRVRTTLDYELQLEAERVAGEHVLSVKDSNVTNAAAVVIAAPTGEILTMLGSLDYFNADIDGQVNVAISERQPGSSFKPFTYVTGFEQGYTPATMIMDVRTSFPDDPNPPYVPENHDRLFHGPVHVRYALARSLNVPAVAMLHWAGVKDVLATAHRMGINTLQKDFYGLSLTLGGGEVTLLDQTYAYSVFANNGVMHGEPVPVESLRAGYRELNPVAILRVEDAEGELVYEYTEPQRREVLRPELAYLITDILSDANARAGTYGPDSPVNLGPNVAVKTGTTSDFRDAWTMGYTSEFVVGAWVGNSDNTPMDRMYGSRGAGPIWRGLMEWMLSRRPDVAFVEPPGLVSVRIDTTSGLLPTEFTPRTRIEIFARGTEPTEHDNVHQPFRVCRVSGKLATEYCPPQDIERQVYEVYPPGAADWVRENQVPQPPASFCDVHAPSSLTLEVAIASPAVYGHVHGVVPIVGNARLGDLRMFQVQFGTGLTPGGWTPIGGEHYHRVENNVLEYWDVSQLTDGLYSLRLVAVEGNGNARIVTIPVIVDNAAPDVEIIHPLEGAVYTLESDEWVNMQVAAKDSFSIDRVEFYLDGQPIGMSTVAPFTHKWTIALADRPPRLASDLTVISSTRAITVGDAYLLDEQTLIDGTVITATRSITDNRVITTTAMYTTGWGIIADMWGYTETHVLHAVAFDAAGNQTESERVRIFTAHWIEEEKAAEPTPTALLPALAGPRRLEPFIRLAYAGGALRVRRASAEPLPRSTNWWA